MNGEKFVVHLEYNTNAVKILPSASPKVFHTHLSAFLCSDVFLKGDHVWDGLDGHQVDA